MDRRVEMAALGGLIALGAVLRLYALPGTGLWLDESNSVIIAEENFSGILGRLRLDSSPALYYLLLHLWTRVAGTSELAVKSLSVLFGVALIPVTYLLGREISGRKVGLGSALLMAIAPLAIYYSREARMYSLAPLLAALCFVFALRFLRRRSTSNQIAYIVATACCIHTHNYGLFIWAAAVVIPTVIPERKVTWTRWLLTQVPVALLYAPWIPFLLAQLRNTTHYSWLAPLWESLPPWTALYRTVESFMPGGSMPIYSELGGASWARIWPALLAILLIVLGSANLRRATNTPAEISATRREFPLLLALFLVPLALPFVYSLLSQPIYAIARTDVIAYPVFLILLSTGTARIAGRYVPIAGIALFIVLSVSTLFPYYANARRTGDREVAMYTVALTRPADIIICTGFTRASLEYYIGRMNESRELLSYPAEVARHLGNFDEAALAQHPDRLEEDARRISDHIEAALRDGRRCLIIRDSFSINRILWTRLEQHSELIATDPPDGLRSAVLKRRIGVGLITLPED